MKLAFSYALSLPSSRPVDRYVIGWRQVATKLRLQFPGATLILHHDSTVPGELVDMADETVEWPVSQSLECMYWRYTSIDAYDAVAVRDADSVPNAREVGAVQAWLDSDFGIHTMHDHPHHKALVMGGMWGAKAGALPYDFPHLVRWWLKNKGPFAYGSDEKFLTRFVYPYAEKNGLNHWGISNAALTSVAFPGGPSPVTGYVGEIIAPAECWCA